MAISFPSNILSSGPQFTIKRISEKDNLTIANIAGSWCTTATVLKQDVSNPETLQKLIASRTITQRIQLALEQSLLNHNDIWNAVLVCESKGEIQSIAVVEERSNKLVYIVTNPENIAGINPVRGAATHIIVELARQSLKSMKDLRLSSTDTAVEFYRKLGFCKEQGGSAYRSMILTIDKIKQLAAEKIPPFNKILLDESNH